MKENKDNKEDNIDNDNPLKNKTTNNNIYNNNLINNGAIPSIINVSKPILTPFADNRKSLSW